MPGLGRKIKRALKRQKSLMGSHPFVDTRYGPTDATRIAKSKKYRKTIKRLRRLGAGGGEPRGSLKRMGK